MKLTHKFLLFGLIPAISQICIVWQFINLLAVIEKYEESADKQTTIIRTLMGAYAQSVSLAIEAGVYASTKTAEGGDRVARAQQRVDSTFQSLLDMTKDEPESHKEIEEIYEMGHSHVKEFLQAKGVEASTPHNETQPRAADIEELQYAQKYVKRTKLISKILYNQSARLDKIRVNQIESRAAVKMLVYMEVILTAVTITAFYALFRIDFGRRFESLLQLARDMSLDKPITTPVSGKDELSYLSNTLIESAEARRQAVAHRNMLFQMVTHDLRSPLMAALLVLDTAKENLDSPAEQSARRLSSIERSIRKVVSLANDLLTIERLNAGRLELKLKQTDLKEVIDSAIDTVRPLASGKNCLLISNAASTVINIDGDRICQVLVNLLSNAIHFSPTQGQIEITVKQKNGQIIVSVADQGKGISSAEAQELFDPFQQGANNKGKGGYGLGLAIARLLVELHHGKIGASPRHEGGTTFWFALSSSPPA